MRLKSLTAIAFAAIAAIGVFAALADDQPAVVVDPKIATMSVDELVAARQAAMEEDGRSLRGAGRATGADAVKIATAVLQNMTNFPALFANGATNAKSHALPIVWQQFDDFTSIFREGQLAATQMLNAAKSGDAGLYSDSLNALNQVCFECHQTYRGR